MFSRVSIPSLTCCLGEKARKKNITLIPGPLQALISTQRWGSTKGEGEELKVRNEHLQSAKPLKDNWALLIAVPHATLNQPELLCNAEFLSMGCFSITFTEVLEDTSTIDFHPFQATCLIFS